MESPPVRRALLSVSDKTGIVEFARGLRRHGVEIVSTGGTARALREAGVEIVEVERVTGFEEMLEGRVKTLHPRVHAGILWRRGDPRHRQEMEDRGFGSIDLVAVNLYPFEAAAGREDARLEDVIEEIDIGGPCLLRSAAKNHTAVTVLCDPSSYAEVLEVMDRHGGATSAELRRRLAVEAFRRTASYDRAIAAWGERELVGPEAPPADGTAPEPPPRFEFCLPRARTLRYGENPHQSAALYGTFLERFEQLHGKELSYNNLLDTAAAIEAAARIGSHGPCAVAVIKHTNPCGAAVGPDIPAAWRDALATDPQSASGGIIACTRPVDEPAAEALAEHFIEVLVAPDFSAPALEVLRRKKNRVLLRARDDRWLPRAGEWTVRSVPDGLLVQSADASVPDGDEARVVTRRAPAGEEMRALRFAWDVVRCVKSNAIVYAAPGRTLGVGAGQMSRVDAARLAARKAGDAGLDLKGSAVASDAFFPFADGLLAAAEAGASCVIQPGGSRRDAEVIRAADEKGIAMVFTGRRHFRH